MSTPLPASLDRLPGWIPPALALLAALLVWQLADVLMLVFAALLLALILRALAEPLSTRLPLSDRVALVIVVGVLLAAALGMLALFGTEVRAQLVDLGERLPAAWDDLRTHLSRTRLGAALLDWIAQSRSGGNVAGALGSAMSITATMMTSLLLVLAGAIYFAAQPDVYWRGAIGMLPPAWRTPAKDVLTCVGRSLRRWLLAQGAAMLLVGTLVGVGSALLGLPSALALGLLAGVAEFVPVVGAVIAALPAILLALAQGWDVALWAALMFFAIQQLEGNVISPLLIRSSVSVPPAVTLFAILGFGALFGVMGVLLAAPLAVTVHVLVTEFWARRLPPPAAGIPPAINPPAIDPRS